MTAPVDPGRDFARKMVKFEIQRARARLDAGRPDRAAVALRRARLWRAQAAEAGRG